MMRKRLIPHPRDVSAASQPWLDVAALAQVELTSEDPTCPIDAALRPSPTPGWRAAAPGAQRIRLVFDHPQALHRLRLVFAEPQQARTQEFVVRWSADGGQSYREVVRQQYTFSPPGGSVANYRKQESLSSQAIDFPKPNFRILPPNPNFATEPNGKPGRPAIAKEVRELIQDMWRSNPTWGSPRIMGELRKLGINIAKATVEKYRPRIHKPPSPTWKAFLDNHMEDLVACDFFTVPTATFRVLFVFIMLAHERRRIVHVNVTEHPTAQWTAQQIVEAFPWDETPRYLLRDRDRIYGEAFQQRVKNMGLEEVKITPRSPWQNPYVERVIGSIRRECLTEIIVLNEAHLRRVLRSYVDYYHTWRVHRSLAMDAPVPRPVHPPELGDVRKLPEVGGLHHHYERMAA